MNLIYLPNIITIFRIFMVPVIVWMIVAGEFQAAFLTVLLAGLTDALDGFLARRFGLQTELGAYLDPIADKAMLMSIYAALGLLSHIPAWLAITVISRDVLIIGAVILSWLLGRAVSMRPLLISKANTALQISLAVLILAENGFGLGWTTLVWVMIWATGLTTALSAAIYLVDWLRRMAQYDMDDRRQREATPPDRAALH